MTRGGARLYAFALPLLRPLRTAHGRVEQREGFLVELLDGDGNVGYGEAMPLPSFGGEGHAACEKTLRAALECGEAPLAAPVAAAALECARIDLEFRARGLSLAAGIAEGPVATSVPINALVAGDTPDTIAEEVERLRPSGFRTWKLKIGVESPDADVARVRALRSALGTDARIRLDANGALGAAEAATLLQRFAGFDIELVEQPIAPGDNGALSTLRRESPIPISADESVLDGSALRALIEAGAVDAVALKPPVLGGAIRALRLAHEARDRGIDAYFTSFLDSSLGIALALHVAAAFGGSGPAHGLGTASFLARDLASPAQIANGEMRLPDGNGLGVLPDLDELKMLAKFRV